MSNSNPTLAEYALKAVYYEFYVHVDGKLMMVVGKPIEWRLYVERTDDVLFNNASFTGKLQASRVGEHYATFQLGDAQLTLWDDVCSPPSSFR
jgi:hypothetical protein